MSKLKAPCGCLPASDREAGPIGDEVAPCGASDTLRTAILAEMRCIPGGFFEMGTSRSRYDVDLDSPRRRIWVDGFSLGATTVTNRLFARFVDETGYRTTAEREGWSFVFANFLPDAAAWPKHPPLT
ncbi:MAG TPA: SUMF1/EgtB/PvdO family nonheme iron enzyme, partial [Bacillales bacterium]|nr:SUMF1/EgtB/PvdO family nonheme iron enzyme [Bacillales bacterium]